MIQQQRNNDHEFPGYRALRTFAAANPRFGKRARMLVETWVQANRKSESKVVSFEGSEYIRRRVFERILASEREASHQKREVEISPENYRFRFEKNEIWEGRDSFVFAITPLRKTKWAVNGRVWIDCRDLQIARIVGSPAKRPSFWVRRATIEKTYRKRGSWWLPERLTAQSSLFIAGTSTLEIVYAYPDPPPQSRGENPNPKHPKYR